MNPDDGKTPPGGYHPSETPPPSTGQSGDRFARVRDIREHATQEESTLKKVLRLRLIILGAVTAIIAPVGGTLAAVAYGQSWRDAGIEVKLTPVQQDVGKMKERMEKLEEAAQEMRLEQAAQRVEIKAAKEAAQGTREDLRLLFPRLPALPPPDGGGR